jgi:hypothetical protein
MKKNVNIGIQVVVYKFAEMTNIQVCYVTLETDFGK